MKGLVKGLVKRGSVLLTDEYPVYKVLDKFYERKTVNYSKLTLVRESFQFCACFLWCIVG